MKLSLRLISTIFFSILLCNPVHAHTELVSADPEVNSKIVDLAPQVLLTFSENLLTVGKENPNKVEVFDSSGKLLSGETKLYGATLIAPVGMTGNGVYTVRYHVAAADGHVVEGSYQFTVDTNKGIPSPMPISAPTNEKDDGPNLLVRIVAMGVIGMVALTLLRRAKSSDE